MEIGLKMKFGVGIIYYNPTKAVLEKLKIYTGIFDEVVIFDNSDACEWNVEREIKAFEKVDYHTQNENLGMSKALNDIFYWADSKGLDFVMTLDQDSEFDEENINLLLRYIRMNFADDVAIYGANFRKIYWDKKEKKAVYGKYYFPVDEVQETDMCITSSSCFYMKAVKEILPLEDYFISLVDTKMSYDLRQRGYRLLHVGQAKFNQQVGGTVDYSWIKDKLRILHHSEERYYYTIRNTKYFERSTGKRRVLCLRMIFNIILGEEKKGRKLRACIVGYKDFKKGVMGKIPEESLNRIKR
jgi:rhamnosyltransferase